MIIVLVDKCYVQPESVVSGFVCVYKDPTVKKSNVYLNNLHYIQFGYPE